MKINKMKEARAARGMTQADLARRVGVSRFTVTRWESDHITPAPHNLRRAAEALEVPVEALYESSPDDDHSASVAGHWSDRARVIEGGGQRRETAPPLRHTMGDLMRVLAWLHDAPPMARQAVRAMLDEIER